jgi:class 3 adenylate cyclase
MAAFGPAGGEQAIIGDTVNVASHLDTTLAVSDETLRAIPARDCIGMQARLREVGTVRLPGCGPRLVWTLSFAFAFC